MAQQGRADRHPDRPLPYRDGQAGLRPSAGSSEPSRPRGGSVPPVDLGQADELNCLRGILPRALLDSAERRARELRVGAEQILIHDGLIDEANYLKRLAAHLNIPFDDLRTVDRGACALADHQITFAAKSGIVLLRRDGQLGWTIAPRGLAARNLARFARTYPSLAAHIAVTTRHYLNQFLIQRTGSALAERAADGLRERYPVLSAAPPQATRLRRSWAGRIGLASAASLAAWSPTTAFELVTAAAAIWFLLFALLRLGCALLTKPRLQPLPRLRDAVLPVYSIVVALYREANSVASLMLSLERLDYPPEKLDIILVLEPDDLQTRAAVARLRLKPQVQVLIAPATGPKTKPKALNFALPFARGSFIAVYDAEDDPDPGQLRAALDVFRRHDDDVACAQASLRIDNLTHSPLSRMFAAEYAGLFEIVLPGLVALGMPLPLGGSSNHFRTSVLRSVGGWDAYNVTEDADLGFRLARFGYHSVTLGSTTLEEAPIHAGAWLRQRTRWMKGWMQTWCVHMRKPRQLWHEAGARGFIALNVLLGGNILAALAFPFLLGEVLVCLVTLDSGMLQKGRMAPLHLVALAAGFVSTIVPALMGLARQRRLRDGWILALTPMYWGCLSAATWRAAWQFWTDRYRWEKTEHGLAKRPAAGTWVDGPSVTARRQPQR